MGFMRFIRLFGDLWDLFRIYRFNLGFVGFMGFMGFIWDLWDLFGIYRIYPGFMVVIRKVYGIFFSDLPLGGWWLRAKKHALYFYTFSFYILDSACSQYPTDFRTHNL